SSVPELRRASRRAPPAPARTPRRTRPAPACRRRRADHSWRTSPSRLAVAASIHSCGSGPSPTGGPMATGGGRAVPGPRPTGQPEELRRGAVGFGGILFQSITFMAPAIATAFSIPLGFSFAGGAAPLAVIVALIASLCVASSVAQMAKHMPTAGSFYTYVSTSIHPMLGFLVAWAFD